MPKKFVYIHGAKSTPLVWNYLTLSIGRDKHDYELLEYDSDHGFNYNLDKIGEKIRHLGDVTLIGHSLGGVYSFHLHKKFKNVTRAVSIASPFGGSGAARLGLFWFPQNTTWRDVSPNSKWITSIRNNPRPNIPWLNVVCVGHVNPWMWAPNDGVVTVASQRVLKPSETFEIETNHHHVLLHDDVVSKIRTFTGLE